VNIFQGCFFVIATFDGMVEQRTAIFCDLGGVCGVAESELFCYSGRCKGQPDAYVAGLAVAMGLWITGARAQGRIASNKPRV